MTHATTFLGEIRKGLLISRSYKMNTLTGVFTLGFIFVIIGLLMGGGHLDPEALATTLLGYLTWMYASLAISDLSWGLRGEISAGTLEQMSMSPSPIGLILLARVVSNLLISTVQVFLVGVAMYALVGIRIPLRWQGIPVLAITLFGVLGFGFVIASAMLVFKHVEAFANLMNNALAFLNGTFLPVASMPGWASAVARALPTTQGIIVLRRVVIDGQPLAAVWQDGSLPWLSLHSTITFLAGWILFAASERIAKRQGTLGQY